MDLKHNRITVGELLDNPRSRAVFQRRFPMVMKHPLLGASRTVTLEQLISFASAYIFGTSPQVEREILRALIFSPSAAVAFLKNLTVSS